VVETSKREPAHPGSALTFFLLTFGWTWCLVTPGVLAWRGKELSEVPWWGWVLVFVGSYGPTIAALLLTARREGRAGVRRLLARFRLWRVGLGWYVVVGLTPLLMTLAGVVLYVRLHGVAWKWDPSELVLLPLGIALAFPFGPLGEELGWRGYALPRLLQRFGALTASLIIGVAWTAWHTPLFWAPAGTTISGAPVTPAAVAGYLVLLIGYSVLYTWVYQNTGSSVLMAFLFHASFNTPWLAAVTSDMADGVARDIELLSAIPLWVVVLVVIARYGPARLRRSEG
jgi:membrane protease YdiL (CAAX protease family)